MRANLKSLPQHINRSGVENTIIIDVIPPPMSSTLRLLTLFSTVELFDEELELPHGVGVLEAAQHTTYKVSTIFKMCLSL